MTKSIIYSHLLPLLFIFISSCSQKHSITGDIKGLGNDTLLVSYQTIPKAFEYNAKMRYKEDTIFVNNDKFVYDNIDEKPTILEIRPIGGLKELNGGSIVPSSLNIFVQLLPNDKIKINGQIEKTYLDYSLKGSKISQEYSRLRKSKLEILKNQAKLWLKKDSLSFNNADKSLIEKVSAKLLDNRALIKKIDFEYIDNHWDSDLTAYLLRFYGKLFQNHEKLSEGVRHGVYKPYIDYEIARHQIMADKKKIKEQKLIKKGKIAPNFTLKNIEGDFFNLYESDTEYMVLDFWGSWCLPCIQGFPKMKEYYKRYRRRVEFIGIACNDREDRWRSSVKKHNVNWIQLFNSDNKTSDVSLKYAVTTYPTKIIIDRQKKIVAVFEGETDDFYIKLDELMK